MSVAIEVDRVSHAIGGAEILRDVSLAVPYGRLLALVGPNGAGKSTLLGVLAGDVRPRSGSVRLDGRGLHQYRVRDLARRRSVLLQSNDVSFGFTAAQVVEMGCAPWLGSDRDDDAAVASATERADVGHLGHRVYRSLSGGERARVSLARVLAQDTPIVMLDEPTAALDLRHQEEVLGVARELAAEGRAVVAVLHDLSLAAAYADDIAMIADGRLVAQGEPAGVLTASRIEAVYGAAVAVIADPVNGHPLVIPRRRPR
ncbi:iron complex transport system ATP-binding protein [Microbacterium resistens]|uniref:Iron complex transport system ATP-binding protein n=1 Tax=Microbacterium resistens TaxID=156977 RepID=A0ABU1SCJ8_9MICO|nr:heme ABC transporter ATP-binding protein [Microbacterium resistens]MDR6866632.1 iron complex transport system ATP-binding protein [Microbacterium resistens]